MKPSLVSIILKAVALGMGVTAIALSAMKAASSDTLLTLLSIGLTALALEGLQNE
ncbi:MAG: hypothetical protein GXP40_00435 [Chloroflexi bacterium]|nr:hypothetical protein [Chloroflexota bacterium]